MWWPPRSNGLHRLTTTARLIAPLLLVPVLAPLLRHGGPSDTLVLAALIGIVVVVAEPLYRLRPGQPG